MNLLLMGCLLASAADLPVGTELQYAGTLTQQSKSAGEAKTIAITALVLPNEDGANQLVWSLEERGAGGWTWPERFGVLAPAGVAKTQPIRVLYTHDGQPNPIGIRSPLFEFRDKLAADATWEDGRLEYKVARKRKVKDRDCWQVETSSNLGRSQTIVVDAETGVLVSLDQRVFMGRGDEFQLKLDLQSQKTLSAADVAKSQTALESLRQLQTSLGRTGEQKVVELTAPQLKAAQDAIGKIEKQSEGTMWAKVSAVINRDLQQQQRRLEERAAGLAKKFVGQPAPETTFKLPDGSAVPAADLQGKVVVLHFWEYRNENLMEPYGQIGYLDFLNGKRKKLGVKVIGVNVDPRLTDRETVPVAVRSMKKLMEFMNLAYDVAIDDGTAVGQYGDPRTLGSPLPLWVVIGHDGKVAHYHIGYYNITPDEGLKELDEAVIAALRKQREAQ